MCSSTSWRTVQHIFARPRPSTGGRKLSNRGPPARGRRGWRG
jgi:hypothetical protein